MKNNIFEKVLKFSTARVELFGAQYKAYGIFGVINFPIAYFILHDLLKQECESMGIRFVAFLLCVPLVFHDKWPSKLQKYLPLYWHGVILYSLPFFGAYMLLQSNVSLGWLTNISMALLLFILLVDWLSMFILMLLGIVIGVAVYVLTHSFADFCIKASQDDFNLVLNQYSCILAVGIFFSRHKEIVKLKERVRSMESLAATIAHELRTPLASLSMVGESMKKYLPTIASWQPKNNDLEFQKAMDLFTSIPDRINSTTRSAFMVIEMILMNLKKKPAMLVYKPCKISTCIELMLHEYPLEECERKLIHWDQSIDFTFSSNELYVKHILFNLLKNALYYIKAANKGEIYIWQEQGKKFNHLYFKDTGQGIPFSVLHHIFENFFSRTTRGTGVGLAFCKSTMLSFGGDIMCDSEEGEFTTFTLSFPVVGS